MIFSSRALLLLIVFSWACNALPQVRASGLNDAVITNVSYLKEDNNKLGLADVITAYRQEKFVDADTSILNFGIASRPVWVRLVVQNSNKVAVMQCLTVRNPWLDQLSVYFQSRDGVVLQGVAGDKFPYAQRFINQRFFSFKHRFESGISVVYIRAESPDPLLLPIYLLSKNEVQDTEALQNYSYGFVYGFIISLALYNAILFLSLRHTRYLYYAIYLLSFIAVNIAYTGHGFKWLWPESVVWQQWAIPILMMLYGFAGLRFATSFLHTARTSPRIHRAIVYACIGFSVLEITALLVNSQVAALYLSFTFVVLFTVVMVFLGIIAVRAKQKSAKYFLYASLLTMVGALLTAMAVLGVIPYSELTYRAVEIGMSIESVLLAMALADHLRLSQDEKIKAERLAKIDPLTGLNNRRGFFDAAKPLWINSQRYNRDASLILMDIDWFKSINDTHGHMQGDKVLAAIAHFLADSAREGDVLARWGGEEFILFLPETSVKKAMVFAERLRNSVELLAISLDKKTIHLTASFGVACRHVKDETLDDLISRGDRYLYQAKAEGRNRVCGEAPLKPAFEQLAAE